MSAANMDTRLIVSGKTNSALVRPLRRLAARHERAIALHLQGMSNREVADAMGMAPAAVSSLLRNPTVQGVVGRAFEAIEDELKGLFPLVVGTLREALRSGDHRVAATARDQFFRVQNRYNPNAKGGDAATAEDVIARILEIRSDGPVTIRMAERRFDARPQGGSQNEPKEIV